MVRYALASVFALGISFGLFAGMQRLIEMSEVKLNKDRNRRVMDFVRLKREESTEVKKRALPKKLQNRPDPKAPDLELPNVSGPGGQALAVEAPSVDHTFKLEGGLSLGHVGAAMSDADAVPMVRVEPTYPFQAQQKGIEGWVLLEFTISTTGAVRDPKVLEASPPGIFDRAAIQALKQWRYKAKVIDGKALETKGVRVKLNFSLNQ